MVVDLKSIEAGWDKPNEETFQGTGSAWDAPFGVGPVKIASEPAVAETKNNTSQSNFSFSQDHTRKPEPCSNNSFFEGGPTQYTDLPGRRSSTVSRYSERDPHSQPSRNNYRDNETFSSHDESSNRKGSRDMNTSENSSESGRYQGRRYEPRNNYQLDYGRRKNSDQDDSRQRSQSRTNYSYNQENSRAREGNDAKFNNTEPRDRRENQYGGNFRNRDRSQASDITEPRGRTRHGDSSKDNLDCVLDWVDYPNGLDIFAILEIFGSLKGSRGILFKIKSERLARLTFESPEFAQRAIAIFKETRQPGNLLISQLDGNRTSGLQQVDNFSQSVRNVSQSRDHSDNQQKSYSYREGQDNQFTNTPRRLQQYRDTQSYNSPDYNQGNPPTYLGNQRSFKDPSDSFRDSAPVSSAREAPVDGQSSNWSASKNDEPSSNWEAPIGKKTASNWEAPIEKQPTSNWEAPIEKPQASNFEAPITKQPTSNWEAPIEKPQASNFEAPIVIQSTSDWGAPITKQSTSNWEAPIEKPQAFNFEAPIAKQSTSNWEAPIEKPQTSGWDAPIANKKSTDADLSFVDKPSTNWEVPVDNRKPAVFAQKQNGGERNAPSESDPRQFPHDDKASTNHRPAYDRAQDHHSTNKPNQTNDATGFDAARMPSASQTFSQSAGSWQQETNLLSENHSCLAIYNYPSFSPLKDLYNCFRQPVNELAFVTPTLLYLRFGSHSQALKACQDYKASGKQGIASLVQSPSYVHFIPAIDLDSNLLPSPPSSPRENVISEPASIAPVSAEPPRSPPRPSRSTSRSANPKSNCTAYPSPSQNTSHFATPVEPSRSPPRPSPNTGRSTVPPPARSNYPSPPPDPPVYRRVKPPTETGPALRMISHALGRRPPKSQPRQ